LLVFFRLSALRLSFTLARTLIDEKNPAQNPLPGLGKGILFWTDFWKGEVRSRT